MVEETWEMANVSRKSPQNYKIKYLPYMTPGVKQSKILIYEDMYIYMTITFTKILKTEEFMILQSEDILHVVTT